MKMEALEPERGTAVILATACIAIVIMSVSCGGGGSTALVPVFTAGISVSSTTVTFGNQSTGTTSAAQTVTLTSSGSGALTISSITASGDFTQTNNCGTSVAAGANCTVSVFFTPTATGTRRGSLSISDNATDSPNTVNLTGTGVAAGPAVSLAPASLIFSSQTVGTTSGAQIVTLTNSGNAALSITSLAVTGANASDFVQTNNCGSSVAAGANCAISVTFTPSASGPCTATLIIADNASGSPQMVSLSVAGSSTAAEDSLSSTSLAFGNQPIDLTSTGQIVIVNNTGNITLNITSLVITGTNASDFAETSICGSSVAAGANCTIAVMFTPSASGARTAALIISDNASGSSQTVSLSGAGIHDVILSWNASTTPGVTGYNVYRGTTSGGESPTPQNPTPISGTTYTDENVAAGATYYYLVKAVDSNDITQSAASNEAVATVPSP
jgi:hypothetical protein